MDIGRPQGKSTAVRLSVTGRHKPLVKCMDNVSLARLDTFSPSSKVVLGQSMAVVVDKGWLQQWQ